MSNRTAGLLSILSAQLIWGFTTPALKIALGEIPPFSAVFIRFAIASLLIFPVLLLRPTKGVTRQDFVSLVLVSLFGLSFHIALLALGLTRTTVISASLIIAIAPIVDLVGARIFLKEEVAWINRVGIIIGFAGVAILVVRPALLGVGNLEFNLTGNLLLLSSIILGSIYVIGSKRLFKTYTALTISSFSFVVSALVFLPFSLVETVINPFWYRNMTLLGIASIVFSGIFASFVAYIFFDWGLARIPVHIASTLSYLTPLVSILIGFFFLQEKIDFLFILCGAVILVGVYLSTLNKPHHHLTKHHRI